MKKLTLLAPFLAFFSFAQAQTATVNGHNGQTVVYTQPAALPAGSTIGGVVPCTYSGSTPTNCPPAGSGGATTPATSNLLKGNGSANGVSAATPGTDYVAPSGNAATSTALAGTPTLCTTGQFPTGILPSGNATGCAPASGSLPSFSQLQGIAYDYYVDNTSGIGSDSAAGTFAAPFASLAHGLSVLTGGHSLGLKAGEEFHEMGSITSAHTGTAASPTYIGTYGVGPQAIISGSDFYASSAWTQGGGLPASDCGNGTSVFCTGFETGNSTFTQTTLQDAPTISTTDTANPAHGTTDYAFTCDTGCRGGKSETFSTYTSGESKSFAFSLSIPATTTLRPSTVWNVFALCPGLTTSCPIYLELTINSSGVITTVTMADNYNGAIVSGAVSLAAGTYHRFNVTYLAGSTTSNGGASVSVDGTTIGSNFTVNTTNPVGVINSFILGNTSYATGPTVGLPVYFDDVRSQATGPVGAFNAGSSYAANVWRTAQTADPKLPNFLGQPCSKQTSVGAITQANQCYWDGSSYLYAFSYANPYNIVEVPQRAAAITSTGANYVTIANLTLRGGQANSAFCGVAAGCGFWNFLYDKFEDSYNDLLFWQFNNGVAAPGLVVYDSVFHGGGESGIKFNNGGANAGQNVARFVGNEFYDLAKYPDSVNLYADAIYGYSQTQTDGGAYVAYNYVHDIGVGQTAYGGGIHADTVTNWDIEKNFVTNTTYPGLFSEKAIGITIKYNMCLNAGTQQYNGCIGVRAGDGISASNNTVQFNTAIGGWWPCNIALSQNGAAVTSTNLTFTNNICIGATTGSANLYADAGWNGSGNTYSGNAFGPTSGCFVSLAGTCYTSYGSFPSPLLASVSGTPLFVNSAQNDYHQMATSPTIGLGQFPSYKPIFTTCTMFGETIYGPSDPSCYANAALQNAQVFATAAAGASTASVSFSTTAVTSESVALAGMSATSKCSVSPTNTSAIASTGFGITAKTLNSLTFAHAATSGMTFDIRCSAN